MKRGEKEQTCLDSVRNILRTKKCNKYLDEDVVIIENILTAKENEQAIGKISIIKYLQRKIRCHRN